MGEGSVAVWLGDAEDNAVVGLGAAPFVQRHEIVCCPSPFISPSILKDHVQELAALRTTTVLPDISGVLRVVVELHPAAL
jgi:hypothetical protein